jgi:site-specific recombinase XerC
MADTISIPTLVSTFLEHGQYLRGWSPKTVHCYQHALATFTPEQITKQSIQQFVMSLQPRGHNPGGVHLIQRALNSFLTWAHEQGHVEEHHKVRLIRLPEVHRVSRRVVGVS